MNMVSAGGRRKNGHRGPVGEPAPHLSGPLHVTGASRFVRDEPRPADLLFAKPVPSPVARGRIVIPANIRHLAGSGGSQLNEHIAPGMPGAIYPTNRIGHPMARGNSFLWVNQTVAQRTQEINDPNYMKGQSAATRLDPMGIGRSITTKINANIGASPITSNTQQEIEKLQWAIRYGADTVMDLSTGGDLCACRQTLIDHSTVPVGTVPIYSMQI